VIPSGGGCAAAVHLTTAPREATGPPLRPQGCFASRCARRPCGPPLTPETSAAPGQARARAGRRPAAQGRAALRPERSHYPESLRIQGIAAGPSAAAGSPTAHTPPYRGGSGSACCPHTRRGPPARAPPACTTRTCPARSRCSPPPGSPGSSSAAPASTCSPYDPDPPPIGAATAAAASPPDPNTRAGPGRAEQLDQRRPQREPKTASSEREASSSDLAFTVWICSPFAGQGDRLDCNDWYCHPQGRARRARLRVGAAPRCPRGGALVPPWDGAAPDKVA
jgi:hypothetical protein